MIVALNIFLILFLIVFFSIPIIISTADQLKLPQEAYFYYPLSKKTYWYFWTVELIGTAIGTFAQGAYLAFYFGTVSRLEIQFDILASRVKETLELTDYENQEFSSFRDICIHHQTIYL